MQLLLEKPVELCLALFESLPGSIPVNEMNRALSRRLQLSNHKIYPCTTVSIEIGRERLLPVRNDAVSAIATCGHLCRGARSGKGNLSLECIAFDLILNNTE